jgi:NTP pyrophosphatase (non-canonical NTP hydrolase)
MSLNIYKVETMKLCKQKGWLGPNIEQVWMYFTEEVGELAGSIRRFKNQFRDKKKIKIESEMGDVFSYLFQLADMLNVDLDQMWEQHKTKMIKKRYYNNNTVRWVSQPIQDVLEL